MLHQQKVPDISVYISVFYLKGKRGSSDSIDEDKAYEDAKRLLEVSRNIYLSSILLVCKEDVPLESMSIGLFYHRCTLCQWCAHFRAHAATHVR